MNRPHGPYATRGQALADAAPLRAAVSAADPGGAVTDEIRANWRQTVITYIDNRLHACGVNLEAYDAEVINWLSLWESDTIQVVLGWVERSHAAAETVLRTEIDTLRAQVDSLETKVRRDAPVHVDFDEIRARWNGGAQ